MIRDWMDWLRHESSRNKKLVAILLSVGIGVVLLAIVSIVNILSAQKDKEVIPAPVADVEKKEPEEVVKKSLPFSFPYEINQVAMAVMNKAGSKTAYAQFSMVLDCPNETAFKAMTLNRAKLVDSIFDIGGNFYLEDFSPEKTPETLTKFKAQLLEKYQHSFQAESPRELVIKDWVLN